MKKTNFLALFFLIRYTYSDFYLKTCVPCLTFAGAILVIQITKLLSQVEQSEYHFTWLVFLCFSLFNYLQHRTSLLTMNNTWKQINRYPFFLHSSYNSTAYISYCLEREYPFFFFLSVQCIDTYWILWMTKRNKRNGLPCKDNCIFLRINRIVFVDDRSSFLCVR